MSGHVDRAPAKVNLGLYVGASREDGLHELRSVFCPLTLSDRVEITEAERDEIVCEGVEGPNLAGVALDALRARGWDAPPVRIEITKTIPVAAGLAGGSADAAAVLRYARSGVPGGDAAVAELADALGADVTSQISPALSYVTGAGESVRALDPPGRFALVLVPFDEGLSAREVYAEFDRIGAWRTAEELEARGQELLSAASAGASPLAYADLLVNDLERAAISLRPEIAEALEALESAGAARAFVSGSGPTACGLFADMAEADRAASSLPHRFAGALVAAPWRVGGSPE